MTQISISKANNTITIEGTVIPVNLFGIPGTINLILWDTVKSEGLIYYNRDPFEEYCPPPEVITSITPYQSYIDQAAGILPDVVFYVTSTEITGYSVGASQVFQFYPAASAPPTGFTDVEPPALLPGGQYYWTGSSFISSPFPISIVVLSQVKDYLYREVSSNVATLVDNQLRSYDEAVISKQADPDLLVPADYEVNQYPTIGDYRDACNIQAAPLLAEITAASTVLELYSFDPTVPEPPVNPNP